jgi:hypothetical protein
VYKGDDGNEYGRAVPPERAGGGVKPGAESGPKILPEPPAESGSGSQGRAKAKPGRSLDD